MAFSRLLIGFCALTFTACDIVETDDTPPPDPVTHPYGAGNGKVVFLSDLAGAERIDVTLGGESIGAVTRFVGCPSRVTTDDSLAVAIRPAGTYQYSAQSATGLQWSASPVHIRADEARRIVLIGRPSLYQNHYPSQLEGYPAAEGNHDRFATTLTPSDPYRLVVTRPGVVQGDRIDVVVNGTAVVRGLALGTTDTEIPVTLRPGPNWLAARLSHDPDGDGTSAWVYLYRDNANYLRTAVSASRWIGYNFRYDC